MSYIEGISEGQLRTALEFCHGTVEPGQLDHFVESIYPVLVRMGINNKYRLAVFLAQVTHETGYLSSFEENLNYSTARLMQIWPNRFRTASIAKRYTRNPKALAMRVYNGRMGNRKGTKDGWDYRGSGGIQLTGRNNFIRAQQRLGIDIIDNPGLVREVPKYAWLTSLDYFINRRYKGKALLELADKGAHKAICRAINGGTHGLAHRTELARTILCLLDDEPRTIKSLIRFNSRGADVRELQAMLRRLGYPIYKIDGHFGRKTLKVVKRFQSDYGLAVDGIIGSRTFSKLRTLSLDEE